MEKSIRNAENTSSFKGRDDDSTLDRHRRETTVEFVGFDRVAKGNLEAAYRAAVASASRSSETTRRETSNVEDGVVQDGSLALLCKADLRSPSSDVESFKNRSTRMDGKLQSSSFLGAEAERSVVDCEMPDEYLIPCHQIKVEPDDSFSEPAEEARTDGILPHLTDEEATAFLSESTDEVSSRRNSKLGRLTSPLRISRCAEDGSSIEDRVFADGGGDVAVKNCSVVLHALDASLLETLSSPYDTVALTDKLKTQTQNCNRCNRTSDTLHISVPYKNHGNFRQVEERRERTINWETLNPGEGAYRCSLCDKKFKRDKYRKVHEKTHSGERPYRCSFCDKTFFDSSTQKSHERTHTGEKPYRCTFCDRTFSQLASRRNHERLHTGEPPCRSFQCLYCEKTFPALSKKKVHKRRHTGEKPHQCSFCSKKFTVFANRKSHERTHTGERPFQCTFCDKMFSQVSSQKNHERTHTGAQPRRSFRCSYCDKRFPIFSKKVVHERTHTGEKPFWCSYCSKKFCTVAQQKSHERTHTGEKPYECSYCDKRFSHFLSKRLHKKKHVAGDTKQRKPLTYYQYDPCEKKFVQVQVAQTTNA